MAIRPRAGKFEREETVAYLHGIDPEGNVVHLLVNKRGTKVRFTGGLGPHDVASQNSGDLESWVHEAQTACGLADVMGAHRGWTQEPEYIEKYNLLNVTAEKKKKQLAASSEF
jgi:hypothetical protein